MALPAPTPPQKRVFTIHSKCRFQLSIQMWETCISGKPREKPVTGEINNCIKKNLGKCRHEKQSLLPTESPGERKYASSCYYYLAGRNPQLCWTSLRVAVSSPSPFPCFNFSLRGRVRLRLSQWWTDRFSLLASGVFRRDSRFANYRFLFCKSLVYFH